MLRMIRLDKKYLRWGLVSERVDDASCVSNLLQDGFGQAYDLSAVGFLDLDSPHGVLGQRFGNDGVEVVGAV